MAGATLVYVATLPDNRECEEVRLGNETLYECNGVLYRSTLYSDERVYEIVSSAEESAILAPPDAPVGPLLLSTPRMRGSAVREVQAALVALGYSVGGPVDGIFGPATDRAVRAFQADYGLRQTGVVDDATAAALGL